MWNNVSEFWGACQGEITRDSKRDKNTDGYGL